MYSIEHEIDEIKKCMFRKKMEELDKEFQNHEVVAYGSRWKDYEQCKHMKQNIILYDFEHPMELKNYIKELWKDESNIDEYFIDRFIVSIFRQKQLIKEEGEIQEITIPSYIYNF